VTDPVLNPPLDQVFAEVNAAIASGSDLPIPAPIVGIVRTRFHVSFARQLAQDGRWANDRAAVLNASTQLGVIAAAIARLRQPVVVDADVMNSGIAVVQQYCEIKAPLGRYCCDEPTA